MISENLLLLLIVLPFLGAVVTATLPSDARNSMALLAGAVMAAMLATLIGLQAWIDDGGVVFSNVRWIDSIGLNLRFRIDGFAWLMMVLVAGIVLTSLVLLVFGVQTLRTAPQTFVAIISILLLAVALDLAWSRRRRRRAADPSAGPASSSARYDVPPPRAP